MGDSDHFLSLRPCPPLWKKLEAFDDATRPEPVDIGLFTFSRFTPRNGDDTGLWIFSAGKDDTPRFIIDSISFDVFGALSAFLNESVNEKSSCGPLRPPTAFWFGDLALLIAFTSFDTSCCTGTSDIILTRSPSLMTTDIVNSGACPEFNPSWISSVGVLKNRLSSQWGRGAITDQNFIKF